MGSLPASAPLDRGGPAASPPPTSGGLLLLCLLLMPKEVDLLLDPICTIFAANCEILPEAVKVGAIYLEPHCADQTVHLSSEDATVVVDLPLEWLNCRNALVAWSVELPYHHA